MTEGMPAGRAFEQRPADVAFDFEARFVFFLLAIARVTWLFERMPLTVGVRRHDRQTQYFDPKAAI